jgi:hypothetical protein
VYSTSDVQPYSNALLTNSFQYVFRQFKIIGLLVVFIITGAGEKRTVRNVFQGRSENSFFPEMDLSRIQFLQVIDPDNDQ